ncbi:MAG: hypothetical protein Q9222_007917, partial [Ikaeria aurantiellina]
MGAAKDIIACRRSVDVPAFPCVDEKTGAQQDVGFIRMNNGTCQLAAAYAVPELEPQLDNFVTRTLRGRLPLNRESTCVG